MRYGMVIDLGRCIGCQACSTGCKVINGTPKDVFWSRVEFSEKGEYPDAYREILPTLCMHCKDAPCKEVCPTEATKKDENGIVYVDYSECIGCLACIEACPYGARTHMSDIRGYYGKSGLTAKEKADQRAFVPDTVSKCTFCKERVYAGQQPVCVQNCVTNARHFVDLDDSTNEVVKMAAGKDAFVLKPEENTNPSVIYIKKKQGK